MSTAYGTEAESSIIGLDGGIPQGNCDSPGWWVVVLDYVISYAAEASARPYSMDGHGHWGVVYADDVTLFDESAKGAERRTEDFMAGLAVTTVRANAAKTFHTRSAAGACAAWQPGQTGESMTVAALDMDGRWRRQQLTAVPVVGEAQAARLTALRSGVTRV